MKVPIELRRAGEAELTRPSPLISIVVPAFNVVPYLEACLSGVLREIDAMGPQSRADLEVIVVDDCSSDETPRLARDLLGERTHARVAVHERNRGPAAARNTGIDASRGDFILFLDSDNTLLEGALARIVGALSEHADADAIILGMDLIDSHGERTGAFYGGRVPENPVARLQADPFLLLDGNIMDAFSIVRSSAARAARYDEALCQLSDWDFWVRLHFEHKCRFAMLEHPVGGYRIRPGQLSQTHTPETRSHLLETLQIYVKALAMAIRLEMPSAVVQRVLANVRNAERAYSRWSAVSRLAARPMQERQAPQPPAPDLGLTTTQIALGSRTFPFVFRGDSADDGGKISRILQEEEYDLARWHQGRRFLDYFSERASNRPGLIIDAGAGIGASAVYFLEKFPNCFVCAIEPDVGNFNILQRNTVPYKNKTNLHAAVAPADGELYLTAGASSSRGFRTSVTMPAGGVGTKIPALSVPSILKVASATVPMIFKCDIAGDEHALFSGDSAWMDVLPVIIVELHDRVLPFSGSSRNFIRAASQHDFDIIPRGSSLLLFNRMLLG
jgi:FkbM family methyltransferase